MSLTLNTYLNNFDKKITEINGMSKNKFNNLLNCTIICFKQGYNPTSLRYYCTIMDTDYWWDLCIDTFGKKMCIDIRLID